MKYDEVIEIAMNDYDEVVIDYKAVDKEQGSSLKDCLLILASVCAMMLIAFMLPICSEMYASSKVKKVANLLSSVQSSITVQPTTVVLHLPTDSFVYGEQGGAVVGDSLMAFNEGSNELSFNVSYPSGDVQRSFDVRLSGARDSSTYKLTREAKNPIVVSVQFRVYGLDSSAVWYADGKRVMPSEDGSIYVTIPKHDANWEELNDTVCLVGYSGVDNSLRDGVIISYDRK